MGSDFSIEKINEMSEDAILAITPKEIEEMKPPVKERYLERKAEIEAVNNPGNRPETPNN